MTASPLQLIALCAVICCLSLSVSAGERRSRTVARDFQREHPCPSTRLTTGACPGYTKDHIKALACGGADAIWNLQWQTIREARAKDKWSGGFGLASPLVVRPASVTPDLNRAMP
jgi:hypothetical protein